MIRLLLRLLGIKDFEVCHSCETLKQQLEFEREEKKQLMDTLLKITNPKVIESPIQELAPVVNTSALFSRRRAAAEARDREEARIKRDSTLLARPDDNLTKLERDLGIDDNEKASEG